MANERRGILYETIAAVALEMAMVRAKIPGTLFWNKKPTTMSIIPDFTIGTDIDQPTHVILVTASGSAKETDKKFWRNAGELQEAKAQLSDAPAIINLYFKSVIKAGLGEVSQQLYDGTLHVDKHGYHRFLEEWVNANLKTKMSDRDARIDALKDDLRSDLTLAEAIQSLAVDLAQLLKQRNTDLDPLWSLMREDYLNASPPPTARTTSVRRGLGKLIVIEPHIRQRIYETYKRAGAIPLAELPDYMFDLKFMTKNTAGARLTDDEIRGVLNLLGAGTCEAILRRAPKAMLTWINPLRDLSRFDTHIDFVEAHYDEFIDPVAFRRLLEQCYADPAGLSGVAGDEKVWVYEIVISLIKAKSGMLQGYGLAQLAEDTGLAESGAGAPLVRFIIPKFVQRQEFPDPKHLTMIAEGLAHRFQQEIKPADIPTLKRQTVTWVIKENLEDRLIPYRNFEPLLWLLEVELKKQGKIYTPKKAYPGWINEYAEVGKRSATTPFVQIGNTLVHWKTSHGSHTNDKTKELMARERNVAYKYVGHSGEFTRRTSANKSAIIIDGDWSDRNLQALADAGWDMIIYPDEIANLVKKL